MGAVGRQVVGVGGDHCGVHAERLEQPRPQQIGVRDAGLRGERVAEHGRPEVGVVDLAAIVVVGGDPVGGAADGVGVLPGVRVAAGHVGPEDACPAQDAVGGEPGQPGAVAGQLGERHVAGGAGDRGPGGAERVVGADDPGGGLVGEEHAGERLGDRADLERGAGLDGLAGPVPVTQAGGADPAVLDQGDGEPTVSRRVAYGRACGAGQVGVAGGLRAEAGHPGHERDSGEAGDQRDDDGDHCRPAHGASPCCSSCGRSVLRAWVIGRRR